MGITGNLLGETMIKTIAKHIDKWLWPQRVAKGKSCNDGVWWFIPVIAKALSAVGGAIGSGIGSAAGAIGSAATKAIGGLGSMLGMGGGGVTAGAPTAAQLSAYAANVAKQAAILGKGAGTGTLAGSIAASSPAIGSNIVGGATGIASKTAQQGLMMGLGKALLKEGVGLDTEASMKENVSNMAVKQMEGAMTAKKNQQPAPVSYDNSISMQAPNFLEPLIADSSVDTSGGGGAGSSLFKDNKGQGKGTLPPEKMMMLIKMLKQQEAAGMTRPIGGYY